MVKKKVDPQAAATASKANTAIRDRFTTKASQTPDKPKESTGSATPHAASVARLRAGLPEFATFWEDHAVAGLSVTEKVINHLRSASSP
ncbi:hypothetical protein GCM10022235_13560 [Kribbella ginsengisoli]|uniref:Uncharacterized protein n=1 Tax=Kribbella ginsengisoli TaxID=363865 RepID=A0ABP6W651_9ACTN